MSAPLLSRNVPLKSQKRLPCFLLVSSLISGCLLGSAIWLETIYPQRNSGLARTGTISILLLGFLEAITLACWLFNRKTEKLRTRELEKMMQLYRFAELGRLAGGLFHDLATPLTALNISLEQARKEQDGQLEALHRHLNLAITAARESSRFLRNVHNQLRPSQPATIFYPAAEIRSLIGLFAHKRQQYGVSIASDLDETLKLLGDPIKFSQIAANLISNAIEAYGINAPAGASINIILKSDNGWTLLTISDQGRGIAPENLDKIFEPFFSTKNPSRDCGLGLGLATTKNIVEKYFKGRIGVESRLDHGTNFYVRLPSHP